MEVRIKLKIKNVEIELTKEEANELKGILNDLVGKEYLPLPVEYPVFHSIYPSYPWYKWEVTWGDETSDPLPIQPITICKYNNI